ncbi:CDC73-domain-containing protein [Aulographum hederae CBS 113979]|uniref:CDC73-domain-containing protein n=1 Tax=Aulographum hederae CBS 113979 TaxID=1176131 RepID=A0A6G1GRC5_9PEZI|nr:CDC73-domain-containing protein [Aulographum hederae CBS 113979]
MASTELAQADPLINLRQSIAAGKLPFLSTTADPSSAAEAESNIAKAKYLIFHLNNEHRTFPLTTPTRFVRKDGPVDLRTILFAYREKDTTISGFVAATQTLNEELAAEEQDLIKPLSFPEKTDLVSFLEGKSDSSEYVKPLAHEEASAQATNSAGIAAGATGGVATVPSGTLAKTEKSVDPRLLQIYAGERKTGDRNSVLRGIRPTDFSHIRKYALEFVKRPGRPGEVSRNVNLTPSPALITNQKKPGRRLEPIILVSPSASSLLRMTNVKQFLEGGFYVPPDSSAASTSTSANILHIQRLLPSVDPMRPTRFILVDTPDQFKPDYWERVVAVFTTGQTWQFKSYKWTDPANLFSHALGVHVGWANEEIPANVKGWGRAVKSVQVDKWNQAQGERGRWRDREVVEGIWSAIESSMRARGWGKSGMPGGR